MNELTTVDFHGAKLVAVKGATPAETLVAMKPVVEGMGLDWEEQRRKLHRHPVLSPDLTFATVQMPGDDQRREWAFLPLTRVNFWLATVQPGRIHNEDVKARVIEYQRECADVLFEHFFAKAGGELPVGLDAKRLGGIVKAVVRSQIKEALTELAPQIVAAQLAADPRIGAVRHVPALQVAVDAGVQPKGRRKLVRTITSRLSRYCEPRGLAVLRDVRGTRLYPVEAVTGWMADEGTSLIRKHKAAVAEPTPLFRTIPGGKV